MRSEVSLPRPTSTRERATGSRVRSSRPSVRGWLLLSFHPLCPLFRCLFPAANFKSREDHRKQIELEEARKAGLAPAELDEDGKEINPHIPQYMSSAPWYLNASAPVSPPRPFSSRGSPCRMSSLQYARLQPAFHVATKPRCLIESVPLSHYSSSCFGEPFLYQRQSLSSSTKHLHEAAVWIKVTLDLHKDYCFPSHLGGVCRPVGHRRERVPFLSALRSRVCCPVVHTRERVPLRSLLPSRVCCPVGHTQRASSLAFSAALIETCRA